MAKFGRSLQDLAIEIERRRDAKQDFIAPAEKLAVEVVDNKPVLALTNGNVQTFDIQDIAHGQLAEYTGIPMVYYRRMIESDPDLLAVNVNRWIKDKPKTRRMVRTLDGNVRAVLSDSYRALENEDLAEAVLPIIANLNLVIVSCEITERRLYIKALDPSIERDVPTGKKMGDASHTFFDTCCPAITISNSEVGYGALSIETGVYTKACTNLAMIGSNMRKYHTGKRAELSDDVYALLTDDTKRATDKAIWLQVRDLVQAAFAQAQFDALLKKLGSASEDKLPGADVVEVVERVGKRFNLLEGERKGVLATLIEGGDLTRYGLHSAVTRFSQDKAVSYDRATELERIGGDVIELPRHDWDRLVEMA